MRTADANDEDARSDGDDSKQAADGFLRSLLGTAFAIAVAALALWPHVRTLIE